MSKKVNGILIELKGLHWEDNEEQRREFYHKLKTDLKDFMNNHEVITHHGLSTATITKVNVLDYIHFLRKDSVIANGRN